MALFLRSRAIAVLLALAAAPALGQTISTLAGNGTAAFAGDTGLATAASLNAPQGVAVDSAGNTYIADRNNNRIRKVDGAGVITTFAGTGTAGFSGDGGAATEAELNGPVGLATDSSGNLYIADSNNHRIRRVSGGIITTVAGSGTPGYTGDGVAATSSGLLSPFGVHWAGDLYIADSGNMRIRRVSGGIISTVAGTGAPGFSGDGGDAVSATLFVPTGVHFGGDGVVYIADYGNRRIRAVQGNTITTVAGDGDAAFFGDGGAATSASLNNPIHVVRSSSGDLYIADAANHRIRKVTAGVISTFAGTGTGDYGGDGGSPDGGSLNAPAGLALFSWGDLVIADSGNNRVRRVSFPGTAFNLQVTLSGIGAGGVSSQPEGIECLTDCSKEFSPLTIVTLTARPALGSAFAGWTGATCNEGQASSTCTFTMTADVTVNAAFDTPTWTITAGTSGAPGNVIMNVGSCSGGGCSATVPHQTPVNMTADPGPQVAVMGWSGVTCDQGNSGAQCSFLATANVAATVTFGYEVQVSKVGVGSGSISSSAPELDCDAACPFRFSTFLPGTSITLVATAAPGFVFDGWEGGTCSGTDPCMFTLGAFTGVSARFSNPVVTPPGAPTLVSATGGDGIITLHFSPPASDGNGAVTSYHAACGDKVGVATVSPIVVNALANGTTYSCVVTALNSAGPGTPSAAVAATPLATVTPPLAYVATDTGVAVIDGATYKVTATIGVPARAVAVNPPATRVFVADAGTNQVRVVDTATNAVIASLSLPTPALSFAFRPAGDRVYVGLDGMMGIAVYDTATLDGGEIDVDANFSSLVMKPDGSRLYGAFAGNLYVFNTTQVVPSALLVPLPYPMSGAGIAASPDGARVYVSGDSFPISGGVAIFDTEAQTAFSSIPTFYPAAQGVAVSSTGSRVYVVSGYGGSRLVAIDSASDTETYVRDLINSPNCGLCTVGVVAAYPDDARVIAGFKGDTGTSNPSFGLRILDAQLEIVRDIPDLIPNAVAVANSVPGAPTIGAATIGLGTVSVAFTPPALNGGSPITGYTVSCNGGFYTESGSGSPITIGPFMGGMSYSCSVTASNAVGTSAASATVEGTYDTTPDAFSFTSVAGVARGSVQTSNTITVSGINAPAPISAVDGEFSIGCTATFAMGGMISNGQTVCVRHTASASYSTPVQTTLDIGGVTATFTSTTLAAPPTVPGAPTIGAATAGNAQASVSFTAPASNGGSAITSYTVTSSPGGFTASGVSSPITVTGLANGTAYTFTVKATNAAGSGPASAASNSVTPTASATVPGAPVVGTATAGNARATVSFTAPASDGGSAITSYTVTSSPGGFTASGAGSPITVTGLANGTAYTFTVKATNAVGAGPASAASNSVTPVNPDPPRLGNISTRMQVLTGDDVMIAGFIIGGSTKKTVVVRARGPSMAAQGVPGTLANPQLQLFTGQTALATNDDWQQAANQAALQASGFAPEHPAESAILTTLDPGAYTAIVTGVGGTTGVAIVEVFEVDALDTPLINIATRGRVLTGDSVMIAGIIIQGDGPQSVVVRARGPSMAALGVPGTLANPQLQLFQGQTPIGVNDNWQQASNAAAIESSGFAPAHPDESAILVTLLPGAYTAIVSGVGGTTGVAIVEVFRN